MPVKHTANVHTIAIIGSNNCLKILVFFIWIPYLSKCLCFILQQLRLSGKIFLQRDVKRTLKWILKSAPVYYNNFRRLLKRCTAISIIRKMSGNAVEK